MPLEENGKFFRTPATKHLIDKLKIIFSNWEHEDIDKLKEASGIKKSVAKIKRAFREFDAALFFVVVFGPVKAGKSTLVNSFARSYVSPTAWGVECTLRPSIVIKHKDPGIDEYFRVSHSVDDNMAFDTVIDYLRKMCNETDLKKVVRKESTFLDSTIVEKKLGQRLDNEPLITVIRVPGGNFLKEGIALLDMPGLDGAQSGYKIDSSEKNNPPTQGIQDLPSTPAVTSPLNETQPETPVNTQASIAHDWVMRRSDFLIYIQSSIAALNIATSHFLKEVVSQRNPPIWLVQNVIEAKYWRKEAERKEEAYNQRKHTEAQLKKDLGWSRTIEAFALNLGKAEDGIFREDKELLAASEFELLEKRLMETLEAQRGVIQERNSVNGVPDALKEAKTPDATGFCGHKRKPPIEEAIKRFCSQLE